MIAALQALSWLERAGLAAVVYLVAYLVFEAADAIADAHRELVDRARPVFDLPPSRARWNPMPDLAILLHVGGQAYARMVTAKGHVHHYGITADGLSRDMRILCGRQHPMRRATLTDLRHTRRRLCANCASACFNGNTT